MNNQHAPQDSSAAKIRAALFSMVAEGRLNASEAKLLLTKTQPPEHATAPIAVIGMAGRFGDCDDLDAYWDMINSGRHCIRTIPEGRWQEGGADAVGGFLHNPDAFDALFFKISPTEAALMDPQQRLFLETAWLALEDAALSERDLAGTACGVFVGAGAGDYGRRLEAAGVGDAPLALMGNVASILAARIAYLLDLKGPALAIDTACSSSLVAVHLACESLRRGECDTAVAGGVCVINSGKFLTAMSQAGMISRSGRCYAFDERADGFVCGEGAGALVLKPLDKALQDGNIIHGVIIGNAINQDGRTNGITAPSAPSQEALERSVQQRFGINPGDIGYIEAHGTGTPLGDPIEVEALSRAFGAVSNRADKIPLGSVKTNIGHALTAAGIAGLLKVLLMLRAGRIPPSADFQTPNPQLRLAETPFRIAKHGETWTPGANGRRTAAISSFGFSGTNAHIVLAEAPPTTIRDTGQTEVYLLLSARDPAALALRAGALASYLRQHPELRLDDVAWTLAIGKTPLAHRTAFIAASREQALVRLDMLQNGAYPDSNELPPAIRDWLAGGQADLRPFFPAGLQRVALPGQLLQRHPCLPPQPAAPAVKTDVLTQIRAATAEFCAHPEPNLFTEGDSFAQVEAWGRKAAAAALLAEGLVSGARPVMTRAALHRDFQVAPHRAGLFDAVLAILEHCGIVGIEGDLVRFTKPPVHFNAGDLRLEWQDLRRHYPATAPFLDLLERTTAALPEVLRGRCEGNSVLFPEGRLDLVGAIYKGNHLADYFNRLMALAVASAVRNRIDNDARPVHILEIGAGTGGASTAILQALQPLGAQVRYTYTDISLGFLKHGRDTFGDRIETALLDITRPAEAQGFATGEFHIIIAANVLHAVPDLKESLSHVYRLLAPEGLLVLNEVTAVQDFATLTFGLTDGWWAFRDPEYRLPGAPLADPDRWQALFTDSGFPSMLNLGLPGNQRDAQAILVAKRDAASVIAAPLGKRVGLPSPQITSEPVYQPPSQSLEMAIQEAAAQTLGMDKSAVDLSGRFMDYGVDSILGLDLINRLNRRYGLELSPTVVFAYPTVRDLARHLADSHGVSLEHESPPISLPPSMDRLEAAKAQPTFLSTDEPIAVIGMAGRFADTDNLKEFRDLLAAGRSGIVSAQQRLGIDPDNPPEHLRSAAAFLRWGGLLKNIDLFDPMFFRISGREAELTDPQHRVFLTEVWRALEDAGYAGVAMEGSDCGIFVGCHGGDYTHLMAEKGVVPDAFAFTGNAASILAARIAYLLDLKGPALAVDTACSSSLVAVHLACQALRAGECGMAIAGGVFINTTVGFNTAAASAGMLSPRGRCAAFDADADGFVPGEGSGAIVLKRLSQAQADGDSIIAVIAGSATNQDGKTNGITAPNAASQTALIRKAHQRAGINPAEINYIETHGTGTRLGDPIEIEGLSGGFAGTSLPAGSCLLGSVKSNVGHAAHAAGIAGLIKTLLSFRHAELYPSLHFKNANPALRLERTPFAINIEYRPWQRPPAGRRVAGISSFGFSGTNCHIVLSDPPPSVPKKTATGSAVLIALSARSEAALERRRHDLRQHLKNHSEADLLDVAFTLGVGRRHFDHRWAVIATDTVTLIAALNADTPNDAMPLADAQEEMLAQAAQLYSQGGLPDFAALAMGGRRIPLPTYPFEELSYWIASPQALPESVSPPAQTTGLADLMVPVWELCPAPQASELTNRVIALTGDMKRCAETAEAFQAFGITTITLENPDTTPLAAVDSLILLAPDSDDAQTLLAPLFAWLRAALARPRLALKLLFVHDGAPLAASAIAASPSLRFVSNHVHLQALAIDKSFSNRDAARHILAELAESDQEALIDRHGQRLLRRLQPLAWQPASAANGGVWLITGGLGGLGPHLARHLGITRGARIALLGRSAPQGDKAERLAELRRVGVQVHYCQADVSDAASLSRAVGEFETVLGPIDGVIHAAGIPSVRSLSESTWHDMQATFAGKIDGTRALDRVLAGHPLRAFVLFASLAAEWGDFGQCDYAVANAFLGRFAASRNREVEAGRRQGGTVALAWPIWEGGHAALGNEGGALVSKALGIAPLAYTAGLAVLDWALSSANRPAEIAIMSPAASPTITNIATANTESRPMDTAVSETQSDAAQSDTTKADLTKPTLAAHEGLCAELTALIARLLKLDPKALKISANFGDFGFDSIALKEFAGLLAQRYGIEISPAVFFAHSSIGALAAYMLSTYPELSTVAAESGSCQTTPESQADCNAASTVTRDTETDGAVAIIGMSGRFPGADDAVAFWQIILSGQIAVGAMSSERRQLLGLQEAEAAGIHAGFINAVETFDPAFFRLSRREAMHMDPQHRLALTATWHALEDAGIVPTSLAGKAVGVFLGQQVSGYATLLRDAAPEAMAQAALGNVNALMPNRISYFMDWRGPSESVDTACSSALVAVHRAVRALRSGECSIALAGASSLLLDMKDLHATQSLGVMSPDGRCHSFDARANGYVKGEGIGIVVLKPLQQALKDGDPIHAVIRGSAVNHGGRAQSLTAPNPQAQSDLIRAALSDAGAPAHSIGYLETHGTGTELGDPVEIQALNSVFSAAPAASVALGAVKANIGHLEPASGIAGLFKSVLALHHQTLPPVADLQTVNPYIDLQDSALYLPREADTWPAPADGGMRRAGVSAFGFGGANAHIILEEAPSVAASACNAPVLLLLSTSEPGLLATYADRLADYLERQTSVSLTDVAYTLMCGRSALSSRAALIVDDRNAAIENLRALAHAINSETPKPATVQFGEVGDDNPLALLGAEAEDQAFFAQLAKAGRNSRLAGFWVAGAAIDWAQILDTLPEDQRGHRVHLPPTPLRQVRCWIAPQQKPLSAESQIRDQQPLAVTAPPAPAKPLAEMLEARPASAPALSISQEREAEATADLPDQSTLIRELRGIIANALYISADDLDDHARFMDLGLDSILAVEVTRIINTRYNLQLQATRLYDFPSVKDLALHLRESLANHAHAGAVSITPVATQINRTTAPSAPLATRPTPPAISIEKIRAILADALYIDPQELDDHAGFANLGLDSILAVEVTNRLNSTFGTSLQATRLYDYPTIAALAKYLASHVDAQIPTAEEPTAAASPALLFLLEQVAATLTNGISPDPDAPLDSLDIGPEQAARILNAIESHFSVRLESADIGACRNLTAVANLIERRQNGQQAQTAVAEPVSAPEIATAVISDKRQQSSVDSDILTQLRDALATLLWLPADSIETETPLIDLGLDRIVAQEFAERLHGLFGAAAPDARTVLAAPGLSALAAALSQQAKAPAPDLRPAMSGESFFADSTTSEVAVAVTGIACRYPGAPDKTAFWELLLNGLSGITRIPPSRWNPDEHLSGLDKPEQREAVQWGGFVDGIDRFDPLFFNLSPREAELMDPQQRLFLEEAWHAFEDAGLSDRRLKGARCGIFIGVGQGDYSRHLPMDDPAQVTGQLLLGNTASILVSRIAYLLDLAGPAVALDTACSSALVAADMGFRAIRDGSCDFALVGGVNLMTTPQMHVMTAASGMLSPDGQCRTFDDDASGFVPGEGIGLLVLRRLDHAQADGDRIYGLLHGAGTNQDGKTSGITAPSSNSQERLEREVWQRFGVNPADFGYIEAHGTGTRLGDPIEIDSLTRAFAAHTDRRQDCPIGSVKSNIGHTLASSGAAGLIKTLLALHHGVIPPSLHFAKPNRHIDFTRTPFYVPTSAQPWHDRCLAAVSSFGFSGTNAHLIVTAAPPPLIAKTATRGEQLIVLSARDSAGLRRQAERLLSFLQAEGKTLALADIAYTLNCRRSHWEFRLAITARDLSELTDALAAFCSDRVNNRLIGPDKRRREPEAFESGLIGQANALAKIGALWVQGCEIPWEGVQTDGQFVDLPGTAFAGLRCWLGETTRSNATPVNEPRPAPTALVATDRACLNLSADMPVMANHLINGRAILPGMASLALFHADARGLGFFGPLSAISWRIPVAAPARLALRSETNNNVLTLCLVDAEGRTVAQATARKSARPQPLPVDLGIIRADCRTEVQAETIYRRLEAGGIHHGAGFRLLDKVQTGGGQIFAQLRPCSPESSAPIDGDGLSPALLDSALQALGALDTERHSGASLLPSGIRQFSVYSIPTGPVFAWLTLNRNDSDEQKLVADLRLLDAQGEVLLEMLGFEARPAQPNPTPSKWDIPERSGTAATANNAELLLLRPHWQPSALPTSPSVHAPLVLHSHPEADWAARLVAEHGGDTVMLETISPQTLTDLIGNLEKNRPILFAAWRDHASLPLDAKALLIAEQRGVHALHKLLKELGKHPIARKLIIVTCGLQQIQTENAGDPAFAALPGFARSAARELSQVHVSCIDLDNAATAPESAKRERAWLLSEPADAVVAYRSGIRFLQGLARILPDTTELPPVLPQGAVCILLGGAGGLGIATSLHLAQCYAARIAWIGRRPLDSTIQRSLDAISQAGGQAIYWQADIVEPEALRQVVSAVRQQWGHITLAWHGAILLRDKSVLAMTPDDLDRVLAPKTRGLRNLIEALTDDPPEFLALCSSANAFTVNPGQANYAAASTFADAMALAQNQKPGWQVRILNWGIWGETGIVAEERYLQRARQAGVEPLTTREGLAIFERSLQLPQTQLIALKLAADALAGMTATVTDTVRFGGLPAVLDLTNGRSQLSAAFAQIPPESLYSQAEAMSETIRYGRERLFRLYAELGLNRHCPTRLTALADTLGIVPERHGLFLAHLDILARCGWVRIDGDDTTNDPIISSTGELPSMPLSAPALQNGAMRLLAAALDGTADVLTGRRAATEILFPEGSNELVEAVYKDDPAADLFNHALAAAVAAVSTGKPLRVIEIGAGTGSATGPVLAALDRHAPGSHYVYTDVSAHFVAVGEKRFGNRAKTEFRSLDIGRHPNLQEITYNDFDIVIAANVLHALPTLLDVLGHVKALLKPDGIALLLEATSHSDFATFTFGLTDGWWAFADAELRIPHSPLLSVAGWRIAAGSRGLHLESFGQMPGSDAQSILMLRSDGWLPVAAPVAATITQAAKPEIFGQASKPLADAPFLVTVQNLVASVLRLDSDILDPDEPLERYGVDSLVVNDINARLQAELGRFPNNLVFEAVTLRALAERLQPFVSQVEDTTLQSPATPAQAEKNAANEDSIAIIGIAGRFPEADDIEIFWDNLEQGRCAIGPLPAARRNLWPSEACYDGGYLQDIAGFDALFFNIAPNEAAIMDPQERLFLETAWASLENAGRLPTAWSGKVGVFVGVMGQDYLRLAAESGSLGDTAAWSVANRISHILNLTGPSLAVNTACSSALTALHLACESLRQGECEAALTGAVHLLLHPASRQGLQAMGMLSASGAAKPFSCDADGMVGGEGVCCLVLRRLDDALAAGDRILGTIRATGLAANGRTRNYMAPNAESQAAALRSFIAQRQVGPISYVECQAVGSPMGDAIELAGLAAGLPDTGQPVLIGSTEGAIGHLEAASGAAQIAKVLGMFNRRRWLPSIGTGELSADVQAAIGGRFGVVRRTQPWLAQDLPHRALIQSFGAGGGSAFAVIDEAPLEKQTPTGAANPDGVMVIPLSARTVGSLRRMAQELVVALRGRFSGLTLSAIAWTLQTGRTAFDHRLVLLADNLEALTSTLTAFLAGRPGTWQQGERKGAGKSNGKGPADNDPATVAAYWVEGHSVDWMVLWSSPHHPLPVALPGYAFEHRHCWIQPPTSGDQAAKAIAKPPAETLKRRPPRLRLSIPVLPSERKLLCIQGPGEADDLVVNAEPLSLPPPGEVLIEVLACGLNFADLLCVRGLHPNLQTYPYLPGFEVAGVVAAVGDGVINLQAGDKVIALSGGRGGLASHVTVPEPWVVAIADDVDVNLAAAAPIGYLTMAHALDRADLCAGETILIQSAAGGTGPIAVQLALARGAKVIATASSAEKLAALRQLGVHETVNYQEEDFFSRVKAITNGRGVDVVLNTLGGDAIQKGIDLLAAGGRYCEIALAGLRASRPLDLSGLTENQSIITINLGRLLADPDASRAAMQDMADALATKRISPLVAEVFAMDQFVAAFRHMDTRQNIGKVILKPDPHIGVSALRPGPTAVPDDGSLPMQLRDRVAAILGLAADEIDSGRALAEYGLNSVGAVALMRTIHQCYGIAVPVAVVYESHTLDGLVARLKTEALRLSPETELGCFFRYNNGTSYNPLVPIRTGKGRPSFWVHGAPGDASWVLGLADAIGGDAPVYGIEARGVNSQDAPRRSVVAMAKDYIAALRDVQSQGPYRLGGYSGGGAIAYEMARQLIASGESIDKLVLLDANAPGNTALSRMSEVYQESFIYQLSVNWFGRRWGMSHLLTVDDLLGLTSEAQLQKALDHLYRHAQPDVGRDRLAAYLTGMNRVGHTLGKALKNYVAKPLPHTRFDTLLLRCTAGMSAIDNRYALPGFLAETDYTAGWSTLLGERLRIENLDCDHFTLLDQPWLDQVGTAISGFFAMSETPALPTISANIGIHDHIRKIIIAEASRVLMKEFPDTLPPRISLNELGAHSVDRAEIAAAAMERLDVAVPLSVLAKTANIDDLVELLAGHLSPNFSESIIAYKTEH